VLICIKYGWKRDATRHETGSRTAQRLTAIKGKKDKTEKLYEIKTKTIIIAAITITTRSFDYTNSRLSVVSFTHDRCAAVVPTCIASNLSNDPSCPTWLQYLLNLIIVVTGHPVAWNTSYSVCKLT
jgi:hypothetical protein